MAGRGSRFEGSGFTMPKPLIPVLDKPMFIWALESLQNIPYSELIIIALKEHEVQYHLSKIIFNYLGGATTLLLLDNVTEGQLCTVLAAKKHIDSAEDILIISSDTIVTSNLGSTIKNKSKDCKGIISVADMPGDRWSFARVDARGRVDKVAEKTRISNNASTGLYYFSNGDTFIQVAEEMIANKEKTKGEYYIIPVYQKYIDKGWEVTISEASAMWDLGTPDALQEFLKKQ